jgi:hypothetical protein
MKDTLQDMIQHTSALGFIDLIKVTGTDKETSINAIAEDKSVIISGTFKQPHPEFIGVFGMPNLNKLKTILGFDDYDANSKITMTRKDRGDGVPSADSIHFETKGGDFINDYRLMARTVIEDKVKSVTFKGTGWNVEFTPTVANILRLKKQASANSEETTFTTKVENGDLKIYFGDPSTHSGNFVFQSGVSGSLASKWQWPVNQVLSILGLPGDKTFKISDQGAAEITVDSGLAVYQYLLPAQSK